MIKYLKNHICLIIVFAIAASFPASLSTQARLNMRIIVTGIAVDKSEEGYEVTAQMVKTTPSSSSGGNSAVIDYISDTGDTMISAMSKLSYKTGKVAAFSHTNFILVGNDVLNEDLVESLDYFVRDKVIKDSALMVVAKDKAKDEIKKTNDVELSVGLGLQKVFLYKQKESDAIMTSVLAFLNKSRNYSKTAVVSTLSLSEENKNEGEQSEQGESGGSGEEQTSSQKSKKGEYKYFDPKTPLVCFVSGKKVGIIDDEDEIDGFMLSRKKSFVDDINLGCVNGGRLNNAKIGVKIKNKSSKIKIRYEQNVPCLDVCVKIKHAEVCEIQNNELITIIENDEFGIIKKEIEKNISQKISKTFLRAKELKADIFEAYDIAQKFYYKKTNKNYSSMEEFLDSLKLNVNVEIKSLEE